MGRLGGFRLFAYRDPFRCAGRKVVISLGDQKDGSFAVRIVDPLRVLARLSGQLEVVSLFFEIDHCSEDDCLKLGQFYVG